MLNVTLDLPSPICAICGMIVEKSVPGFAVPDSVQQVKLVPPRKLPLRCTEISAEVSPEGTSRLSAASSTFVDPPGATADELLAAGAAAAGAAVAGRAVASRAPVGEAVAVVVADAATGGEFVGGAEARDAVAGEDNEGAGTEGGVDDMGVDDTGVDGAGVEGAGVEGAAVDN